jgi:hypothetical protein
MSKVNLPLDICNMIADYIPDYVYQDWIDPNKLNWCMLSSNPDVMELLLNPDKIIIPDPAIYKPVRDQDIVDILYEL